MPFDLFVTFCIFGWFMPIRIAIVIYILVCNLDACSGEFEIVDGTMSGSAIGVGFGFPVESETVSLPIAANVKTSSISASSVARGDEFQLPNETLATVVATFEHSNRAVHAVITSWGVGTGVLGGGGHAEAEGRVNFHLDNATETTIRFGTNSKNSNASLKREDGTSVFTCYASFNFQPDFELECFESVDGPPPHPVFPVGEPFLMSPGNYFFEFNAETVSHAGTVMPGELDFSITIVPEPRVPISCLGIAILRLRKRWIRNG